MHFDWFTALFETTGFLTLDHTGPWSRSLVRVYLWSNGLIALACLLISICLYIVWTKRQPDLEYGRLILLFASFITSCGLTHVCDTVMFWWPGYRLFSLVSVVAAVLSVYTALKLPGMTTALAQLPSPARFDELLRELQRAIICQADTMTESSTTIGVLRRQVDHLERMRETGLWVADQESALRKLKAVLDSPPEKESPS